MKSYVGQKSFVSLVSHFKWTIFHRSDFWTHKTLLWNYIGFCLWTYLWAQIWPCFQCAVDNMWMMCPNWRPHQPSRSKSKLYISKFKKPSRFFWWGILMYSEWHFFCWMDFDTTCYLAEEWEVFKVDFPESLLFLFMHTTLKSIMCW